LSDRSSAVPWQLPSLEAPVPRREPDTGALAAEAYRQGFDAGYAEGISAGRERGEAIVAELTALWQAMRTPWQEMDETLLRDITHLVKRIAEAVVRRELTLGEGDIEAALEEAVHTLGAVEGRVEVVLNPADAALVRELLGPSLDEGSWRLVEEEAQLRGGCLLRTATSFVDASVERQLDALTARLSQLVAEGGQS